MDLIPHRYPFLLVDRILEMEAGKRIVGLKNVTMNEEFFQGHFPGRPVMPGVLMVEAMAQVGAVLLLADPGHAGKIPMFMSVDKCKFRRQVAPGDQLVMEVTVEQMRSRTGKVSARGTVDGQLAVEAELMFALVA